MVQKHCGRAEEDFRRSLCDRVVAAIRPFAERSSAIDDVMDISDRLIRSVVRDAESHERGLAMLAPPLLDATKKLPREFFIESYELSVRLVEAILSEEFNSRAISAVEANRLRGQISEIAEEWRMAVSTVIGGKYGGDLAGVLAEIKKEELDADIGQPFVGLRTPLDDAQMQAVKRYILDEVTNVTERPVIDDLRIVELYRAVDSISRINVYETLGPEQRVAADQLQGLINRLGNVVHVVWNYSHPKGAPLLLVQKELRRRIEEFVKQTQLKEGTGADAQYQNPHLARRPLPSEHETKSGSHLLPAPHDAQSPPKSAGTESLRHDRVKNVVAWLVIALLSILVLLTGCYTIRRLKHHPQ